MEPLVSLIIPTYNRMVYLEETIDSVLSQSYSNWECIVVDDGSIDNTAELIKVYSEKDARISYYMRPLNISKGAGACRNFGLKKSGGDLIMWIDDDDLLHEDKIKNQVLLNGENCQALITCAWGRFTTRDDFVIKDLKIYKNYAQPIDLLKDYGRFDCFFPCHAFLVPRSLIEKSGFWRTDLAINDDGEFFSRVILVSPSVLFAEKTHVKYRYHHNNRISAVNSFEKAKDLVRSWKLIKENFTTRDGKKVQTYLSNGTKHSYTLLKTNGFKMIILSYFWLFKALIFKDGIKKLKSQWKAR